MKDLLKAIVVGETYKQTIIKIAVLPIMVPLVLAFIAFGYATKLLPTKQRKAVGMSVVTKFKKLNETMERWEREFRIITPENEYEITVKNKDEVKQWCEDNEVKFEGKTIKMSEAQAFDFKMRLA